MRNLVSEYVTQFRQDRQKQIRLAAILAALAVVVAGIVFWQLHSTGVAMSNEVYCGMEEHVHDDSCYEQVLICNSEEEDHVHDDSCYETVLVCDLPEHTHTVDCLVDETADVETADVWESTLPVMSGIWADDVAATAESQVGYTESKANYILADDGATHLGYSRYGAWYGNEYGDWDAMFVSFCLNYAAVPESEVPENSGAYALATSLDSEGLYVESANGFTPATGDLVFFDEDQDGQADRVGIVIATDENELIVVEGNYDDSVAENTYKNDEPGILAFGLLPEQDLTSEAGMYTISYSGEIPGAVEIEGPAVAEEGTDQYFYVTVSEDYEITGISANGEELTAQGVTESEDGESSTYAFLLEDISDDTIVVLDATQVLKGSGSVTFMVYTGDGDEAEEYTLTVTDVPTNTKISLNSPQIALTDAAGDPVNDMTLEGNLYYVANGGTFENGQLVAYLMLDDDIEDSDAYVLTPYSDNGAYDLSRGYLALNIPTDIEDVDRAKIWEIQTNKLCFLDANGNYQQELVEAVASFSPLTFVIDEYSEGETVDLEELTEGLSDEFYYGYAESVELTPCTEGIIEDGQLLPLDESGKAVEDYGSIYMVTDRVYSFDVEVNNIVNEHTEDNGDTYLWTGDTFYIDQYFHQGYNFEKGYTRSQNTLTNCGAYVQLGRLRETAINGGTASFSDYADLKYDDIKGIVDWTGYDSADAVDPEKYNYGIVGPYQFKYGESAVETTTVRITGHVGDEFTAAEVFGDDIVYMITNQKLQTDWINLGCHASDNGYRGWFYWINDYYKLNNYEDEVEFVKIYERENDTTGETEIRMEADEIGHEGIGELDDIWEITGLYTKRTSAIKNYMLENQDILTEAGVGFYVMASWPEHIQLRMTTTVESVINNAVYNGVFTILYDYKLNEDGIPIDKDGNVIPEAERLSPQIKFNIAEEAVSDPSGGPLNGTVYLTRSNEQETSQYQFGYRINPDYAFDPDYVSFEVTIHATGTLTSNEGDPIVYDEDNPLVYTTTLTAEQLIEAYDECPNNEGYDVAINLADAVKVNNEYSLLLYKVWDDYENSRNSRDDVTYVTVALERSTDEENWELVVDESGLTRAFVIRGDCSDWVWNLTLLDGEDLDITYTDSSGDTKEYFFRIAEEQDIVGVADGFSYTYTLDDEEPLIVINHLNYKVRIEGTKAWLDQDGNELDEDDSRIPDSVIIGIDQNGEFFAMTEATRENGWTFSFEDLPQSVDDWEDVNTYTLYELDADGNRVDNDGFILIDGLLYHVGISQVPDEDEDLTVYALSNSVYTADLPVTGGTGTWIFTVAGVCLIGGAAVTLVYRKRRAVRS